MKLVNNFIKTRRVNINIINKPLNQDYALQSFRGFLIFKYGMICKL